MRNKPDRCLKSGFDVNAVKGRRSLISFEQQAKSNCGRLPHDRVRISKFSNLESELDTPTIAQVMP
jgi:hypothetical protein